MVIVGTVMSFLFLGVYVHAQNLFFESHIVKPGFLLFFGFTAYLVPAVIWMEIATLKCNEALEKK